jgi:hypothetical protein
MCEVSTYFGRSAERLSSVKSDRLVARNRIEKLGDGTTSPQARSPLTDESTTLQTCCREANNRLDLKPFGRLELQSRFAMGDERGGVYSQPAECVNWFCLMHKRIVKRDKSAVFLKVDEVAGTRVRAYFGSLGLICRDCRSVDQNCEFSMLRKERQFSREGAESRRRERSSGPHVDCCRVRVERVFNAKAQRR